MPFCLGATSCLSGEGRIEYQDNYEATVSRPFYLASNAPIGNERIISDELHSRRVSTLFGSTASNTSHEAAYSWPKKNIRDGG